MFTARLIYLMTLMTESTFNYSFFLGVSVMFLFETYRLDVLFVEHVLVHMSITNKRSLSVHCACMCACVYTKFMRCIFFTTPKQL